MPPEPEPALKPIPVLWRVVCWLVAAGLFLPGLMVVADHPALGVALIANGLAMGLTLRLDSGRGTILVLLGLVAATILSGIILGGRIQSWFGYARATWPVALVFSLMPLRVCFYAVRNHRRLGKTLGQILVVVLDLRRLLVFVALAPLVIWWWVHPLERARTWLELEEYSLAERAGERIGRGADQELLLQSALGSHGAAVDALIEEGRTWPWLACGQGLLEEAALTETDFVGDPHLTSNPGFLRSPTRAAAALGSVAILEGAVGPGVVVPEEHLAALAAVGRTWPPYDQAALGTESAATGASQMIAYLFGSLCAEAAGQPAIWFSTEYKPLFTEALRLGHLPYIVSPSGPWTPPIPVWCVFCGEITGPAVGVTERQDGSLVWTNDAGAEVVSPPITWMPRDRLPDAPRETMPPPKK